jgi:hypothetical protein
VGAVDDTHAASTKFSVNSVAILQRRANHYHHYTTPVYSAYFEKNLTGLRESHTVSTTSKPVRFISSDLFEFPRKQFVGCPASGRPLQSLSFLPKDKSYEPIPH